MSSDYTPNLNLRKPSHRDPETLETWDYVLNGNFDSLDAAFGLRTTGVYILSSDSHSASLKKLDDRIVVIDSLIPTSDQKAALLGITGYAPNSSNPYVTLSYVSAFTAGPKKAILAPEYAGAVLYDGGVPTVGGTLVSDFEWDALSLGYNFYKWISTEAAYESYQVVVRWKVPETFISFKSTGALIVDVCTEDAGANTYVVGTITKMDDPASPLNSTASISTAGVWSSERSANQLLYYDASDTVLASIAAGDVLGIFIRMYSQNSMYAKIGDITISYTG